MTAPDTPTSGDVDLLTGQAYRHYRDALPDVLRTDLDLVQRLAERAPLMRVLYLAALDLEPRHVDTWAGVTDEARAEAHAHGLVYETGAHTRLTRDGFHTWWRWQYDITPHLHKPWFRDLWKRVCGW